MAAVFYVALEVWGADGTCVIREGVSCTHQPRGDFPPLAQLRQGRQADVIWKQKNKISGERKTTEGHQGEKKKDHRPRGRGSNNRVGGRVTEEAWRIRASTWGCSLRKKTAQRGRSAEGWSLTPGRRGQTARGHQGGDAHPDTAHDQSVQIRAHAAHDRRGVRIAALSAPPRPPEDTTQPRAGGAGPSSLGACRCCPGPAEWKAVWAHLTQQGLAVRTFTCTECSAHRSLN